MSSSQGLAKVQFVTLWKSQNLARGLGYFFAYGMNLKVGPHNSRVVQDQIFETRQKRRKMRNANNLPD